MNLNNNMIEHIKNGIGVLDGEIKRLIREIEIYKECIYKLVEPGSEKQKEVLKEIEKTYAWMFNNYANNWWSNNNGHITTPINVFFYNLMKDKNINRTPEEENEEINKILGE